MTKVTIYQNKDQKCMGFQVVNHAGYAEEGNDIVCAAISMIVINTINSIETFTEQDFVNDCKEDASIVYKLSGKLDDRAQLLLDSMVLGLQTIEDNEDYTDYIDLVFEEV